MLPFHPTAPNLGLQFIEDLAHDWTTTHAAWNDGKYDQWVPQKGTTTMAHLTRNDIPFHYALADAFTVCDAYHCSLLGPTDPEPLPHVDRLGGQRRQNGGPVSTMPSRIRLVDLSRAAAEGGHLLEDLSGCGVGLKAAHFWGLTDDAYIGNYGDNSLLYFHQYQNAPRAQPLAEKARTGTNISKQVARSSTSSQQDVKNNNLPQVSWIVAPEAYTEHPNWPANYGAWYVSQMLDALTANPGVWSKTAFIFMFDENDGFFDHMVPPTPPQSRTQGLSTVRPRTRSFRATRRFPAGPYGLGVRVPMIVISPWSKGGWVNSEVFDHTSLIHFVEQRFGNSTRASSSRTSLRGAAL